MPLKSAVSRSWNLPVSSDGRRWSDRREPVSSPYALEFPSNTAPVNKTDPYAVIKFSRPDLNGLPFWGPGNAGWTLIRKIKTKSVMQVGYNAIDWMSQDDGGFGGSSQGNVGAHGYPVEGFDTAPNTNNYGGQGHFLHEIATFGLDVVTASGEAWVSNDNSAFSGTNFEAITKGTRILPNTVYVQAVRAVRNSATSKVITYYWNLPSLTDKIEVTITDAAYGETQPPNMALIKGDSPWFATFQHERADCFYDAWIHFAAALSDSTIQAQSQNFSYLVNAEAQAAVWHGRNGFDAGHIVDGASVPCHFGTGRSFSVLNPSSDPVHQIKLASRV